VAVDVVAVDVVAVDVAVVVDNKFISLGR